MPVLSGVAAPAAGTNLGFVDVGSGVKAAGAVIVDTANNDAIGLVAANPNAQSVLGRLKTIADNLTSVVNSVDGLEGLATTLNGFVDGLESGQSAMQTTLGSISTSVDGLENLATSLNTFVDNLESQNTTLIVHLDGVEAALALLAPATQAFAITPHDANALSTVTRAIHVGGAGNIALRATGSGSDVTIAVVAGQRLDIAASHVRATGTTATGLVGLA